MPAEMVNGVADVTSTSTRGHFISSLISGAAWAIGALLLVGAMKRNPDWHDVHIIGTVLVVLTLIASFALRSHLPDGLAQRIGNALFCAWFALMSLKLIWPSNE
jgi:glucose uptake protein GlcU